MTGQTKIPHVGLRDGFAISRISVAVGSGAKAVRSLRQMMSPRGESANVLPSRCEDISKPRNSRHADAPKNLSNAVKASLSISATFKRRAQHSLPGSCVHETPFHGIDLDQIASQYQPVLLLIAEFLASSPRDVSRFCNQTSTGMVMSIGLTYDTMWSELFLERWPAFHACLLTGGRIMQEWRKLYERMLKGNLICVLEVFDREKKLGFAMSAMPAKVWYTVDRDCYIAKYISGMDVQEELIPHREGYRLRSCPSSVVDQLCASKVLATCSSPNDELSHTKYPYSVLSGTEDLAVDQGVELQWKMQPRSPFGWWHGHLESLHHCEYSSCSIATIVFAHFEPSSRYHRMQVRLGNGKMHEGSIGGFTGGMRPTSAEEELQWMLFFPREALQPPFHSTVHG